jgi:hypothetical protein
MRLIACWEWRKSSTSNLDDLEKLSSGFRGCTPMKLLGVPESRRVPDLAFAPTASAASATVFKPAQRTNNSTQERR